VSSTGYLRKRLPSELVVLADEKADPDQVASDLMAQLEHGPGTRVCLVTSSEKLATNVEGILARELRPESFTDSLVGCVLVGDLDEGLQAANILAPEHLIIFAEEVADLASRVKNAGAVFLGADSPVALGDYAAGTNHVLPTGGTARFASPLGVYDFVKRTNVVYSNPRANRRLLEAVVKLSEVEGLPRHGESVKKRQTG
ncbi:MAG: histidinol dehydrogenase, partial [Candidatus Geothermincolales bacterium]